MPLHVVLALEEFLAVRALVRLVVHVRNLVLLHLYNQTQTPPLSLTDTCSSHVLPKTRALLVLDVETTQRHPGSPRTDL